MKRALPFAAAFAILAAGRVASAYCPSYSPDSTYNTHDCGVAAHAGKNPTTAEWQPIFDLVSRGPAAWGDAGPTVTDIGQGCGKPEPLHSVPARFPCELLQAIAMTESSWRQFCVPDLPADQVGGESRTIISFDCGYGVGQVTSGMHTGEDPGFDRDRVASDPTYNLATGTRILASKWKATECVGDNQPTIIEHWYSATWAYNGLAYVNNPNNPNYDTNRGVWDPDVGGAAPYQEKVFGRMEHTGGKWTATELAYPNPGDIGTDGSPNELPEPDCASPTDCAKHRSTHATSCKDPTGTGGSGGGTSSSTTSGNGGWSTSTTTSGNGGHGNADADGGPGAGGDNTGGSGGSHEEDGGCGCRAASTGDTTPSTWAAIALAIAVSARRSQRRKRSHGR
ncbi:N-acetylmuramoyl-L-alanine amidase [Minicystis rosea]|nr:N-acetylmuramoyl-L-alanine amidase [Minicystis rosea]